MWAYRVASFVHLSCHLSVDRFLRRPVSRASQDCRKFLLPFLSNIHHLSVAFAFFLFSGIYIIQTNVNVPSFFPLNAFFLNHCHCHHQHLSVISDVYACASFLTFSYALLWTFYASFFVLPHWNRRRFPLNCFRLLLIPQVMLWAALSYKTNFYHDIYLKQRYCSLTYKLW